MTQVDNVMFTYVKRQTNKVYIAPIEDPEVRIAEDGQVRCTEDDQERYPEDGA